MEELYLLLESLTLTYKITNLAGIMLNKKEVQFILIVKLEEHADYSSMKKTASWII